MRIKTWMAMVAVGIALAGASSTAQAGITNAVPWWDAFESYTNGTLIDGTNGWSASIPGSAAVSTDATVTALLTNYPTGGKSYPLATTHSNVLQFSTEVRNAVNSGTGGVVKMDFMVLPTAMETPPTGDTNVQCSFCVSTNNRLTIWHYNVVSVTNEWRELANSPPVATNAWSRFTIVSDYSNGLFQVRVNEGNSITDSVGWLSSTGGLGGAWFHMVQTNRVLAGFKADGGSAYLDDVLLTNRTLTWSGGGFVESALQNGAIATNPAFTVTLGADTFTGATNADLVALGVATATNVPAGLTAVVTRVSATQAVVTLAGVAAQHESANTRSNLAIRFADAAFGFGSAWDVVGNARTNLTVTFYDTPRLTWSTNAFWEAAANDGSVDNTTPLLITLTNGTFNLTLGADFGADTSKVTFTNLPPGLTAEAILTNAAQVRVRFLNKATANAAANSLPNLGIAFQDGAFVTVPASSVFNGGTNVSVTFSDPGVLTYTTNVFRETAANNGAIGGTTLSLVNKTFSATNNEDLVASLKVTPVNVPGGLTLHVVATDSTHATLSFTGNATNHTAAYSIGNLGVTFNDTAFTGGNAAAAVNGARSDLQIQFADQPVLSALATAFTEAPANNGSIGNALTVALTGDAFTSTGFTAGVQYTVANVPNGLSLSLAPADATHLTATLTGTAASHAAVDSISNIQLAFLDPAFANVASSNVRGQPLTFSVAFSNQPSLTWSGSTFHELAAGVIDNRLPITITVSGETFAGADGQNFVAAGWLTVVNLPAGLTAVATRNSATQLTLTLAGRAANNAVGDSVANVQATFQPGAFTAAQADQVTNYRKTDLSVAFIDDLGFYNVLPYAEPFEAQANGSAIDNATNGWSALYDPNAGVVTNDPTAQASESQYLATHAQFPISGNHAQTLFVQDYLQNAIHSETAKTVCVDFMAWPVPLQAAPESDTNVQCAFYISTNSQFVIWHNNRAGASPVNEWLTLTNAGTIDTSRWMRVTIAQDYTHNLFQVRVNESQPIAAACGWTDGGASRTGSWYYMVQTNGTLTGFRMSGVGAGYLDDLTVKTSLPVNLGWRYGIVFQMR